MYYCFLYLSAAILLWQLLFLDIVMIQDIDTVLAQRFGFGQFQPGQRQVIEALLTGQGKYAEVVELLASAEPTARRRFTGDSAPRLGRFLILLGRARAACEEFETAEANLLEACEILSTVGNAPQWNPDDAFSELEQLYAARHAAAADDTGGSP